MPFFCRPLPASAFVGCSSPSAEIADALPAATATSAWGGQGGGSACAGGGDKVSGGCSAQVAAMMPLDSHGWAPTTPLLPECAESTDEEGDASSPP